jgi:hypothetical protein
MPTRKRQDNGSDAATVLGLDALGWLFALVSGVVGGVADTLIFDNMAATAQKAAYPELALGLMICAGFVGVGGGLFTILSLLRRYYGRHRT